MTSLIISTSTFSLRSTSKTWCGTSASQGSFTVQSIEKHSSKHSIFKMEYLWSSKNKSSIYHYFMMSSLYQARWTTTVHSSYIRILLDVVRHRERIEGWSVSAIIRSLKMFRRSLLVVKGLNKLTLTQSNLISVGLTLRIVLPLSARLCMASSLDLITLAKVRMLNLPQKWQTMLRLFTLVVQMEGL